mgnify:CR=1 FL=1
MPAYKAPLREIRFVLYELLKADTLSNSIPAYAEATPDTIDARERLSPVRARSASR